MKNAERKYYETPTLKELGDLKEITQAGNQVMSDGQPFVDGTAFGPELAS
ncbi:MAG: lasso RiPP family leader peptide-containing protein [Pseudomonadota bacterium]